MNVHLVDGTYELFRSYYGGPGALGDDGREVGAVRTLLRSLGALLRDPGVSHLAVAFDHVIESFRNELFSGYKTSAGVDPALLAQFGLAEEATRALGLVTWPMVELEADDALATAASRFAAEREVQRVVLCSPDKDLYQCVEGNRVVCWDRMRRRVLDEAAVKDRLGIAPSSVPDYLALVGDAADGIPGIARWGARSAALVLARYGTIEAIPLDASSWEVAVRGARTLAANLAAEREAALLYKQLATLRRDAPISESLADLAWRGARRSELDAICRIVGAPELPDRVPSRRGG